MIAACVDTNILISFLLTPFANTPPTQIMRHALSGTFQLVLVETTILELKDSVSSKPYLARRISVDDVEDLLVTLHDIAKLIPAPAHPLVAVTRDPRDDYLLAPAVLEAVQVVVSGDKDLLILGKVADTHIVSPAAFIAILDGIAS